MLDKLFYRAVNGKEEITSPIVIKDFNENPYNLTRLLELKEKVKGDKSKHIAREEYSIKQSLLGEKNVIFELKNSDVPMLILHDIRLKIKDYYAVFDFILITKKKIYILKTKKLTGDITITDEGQFIRKVTTKDGKYYKDSLFSPYTQNERGIGQLSSFLSKDFKNVKVDHFVVLANNRSILKKSYAPKEIQDKVIKLDQLILKLKEDFNNSSNSYLEKTMKSMGELIVFSIQLFTVIYILSFIVSVIVTFIRYYNFIIYEQDNKLNIQYGLISLKKYTLPIKNIQAIKLKQTLINQWFKQYKVEVVTAGYGDEEKEEAIFYPLTDKGKLNILIDTLITNFKFENIELKYPPKKARKRFFIFPVIFSIVIFLVISFIFHKAVFIFMFMPIIIFSCYMEYRNNTMGYDERIFYGSFGAFSKTSIIIKMNSVQSITETTNYFQRKMGVCNYKIDFYSSKLIDILAIKNMHRYHFRDIEKNIEF